MAVTTSRTGGTFTIDRAEQLKALGHPLRLKVLQVLGDTEEPLTNRDLAERIGVDPGHLHFHVRMLHRCGLIALAEGGRGREKPYRPVAAHIAVGPEFRGSGLATNLHAAMLDEVGRGWEAYGATAEFRGAQLNVRLSPDTVRALLNELIEKATALEDESEEILTITVVAHPLTGAPPTEPEPGAAAS